MPVADAARGHFDLRAADSAEMFRYGHGTWVSADGTRWPVSGRFVDDRIVFEVCPEILAQTSFPAVLDPLVSPEFDIDQPSLVSPQDNAHLPAVAAGAGLQVVVWTLAAAGALQSSR